MEKAPSLSQRESKEPRANIDHLRHLALSAMASSALLMSAPASAEKYEHSPAPTTETIELLKGIGLDSILADTDIEVRIPRISASGHYIVQLDVGHIDRKSEDANGQRAVIEVQKQSYAAIRSIVADRPYTTFYPEGITKEKGASAWETDKQTLHMFQTRMHTIMASGHVQKETVQQALNQANAYSQNVTGLTSGETVRTLAATGLSMLSESKDPEVARYLHSLAPLGEDTLYYYGGLKYAYEQGYVQNIQGCEDLEELERINKLFEQGEHEKVNYAEREKKLVECLADELRASGDNFVVTAFGASHDFSNEIDEVDKCNNQDVGYIVLTPLALSWYVQRKKSH